MNRLKRWMAPAILLVSSLVLAVPAMASAHSGMELNGKPIALGSVLYAPNIGTVTFETPKIGNLTCEQFAFESELSSNRAEERETEIVKGKEVVRNVPPIFETKGRGEGTSSGCRNGGSSFSITNLKIVKLSSTEVEAGKISLSYQMSLPSLTCSYTGTEMPFTFKAGGSAIRVSKGHLTPSPAACGSAYLDAEFGLYLKGVPALLY